jgi:hypothetical protein
MAGHILSTSAVPYGNQLHYLAWHCWLREVVGSTGKAFYPVCGQVGFLNFEELSSMLYSFPRYVRMNRVNNLKLYSFDHGRVSVIHSCLTSLSLSLFNLEANDRRYWRYQVAF